MTESDHFFRYEYHKKIQELVDSGRLPKSYRVAVQSALVCVSKPTDAAAIKNYEKYKKAIPNVPNELRYKMDEYILERLVSEKRLSLSSKNKLLRELGSDRLKHSDLFDGKIDVATANFDELNYIQDIEDHEMNKFLGELDAAIEESNIATEERNRLDEEALVAERREKFQSSVIFGSVAVVSLVIFFAFMNSLASFINNNSDLIRDNNVTKGSGGFNEDALRDAANALYDKCQVYGSSYDGRCN